jgi:hypothetical protein
MKKKETLEEAIVKIKEEIGLKGSVKKKVYFRKNPTTHIDDIKWVCEMCGEKYGDYPSSTHRATWHMGTCDICYVTNYVTEPRDFLYLKKYPIR